MTMGGDPIRFPDAAAAAITHFNGLASLSGVDIHKSEPNPLPTTPFILVRRVGGPRRNIVIDDAYLMIEAWAPTSDEAHDIGQITRAEIHGSVGTWMGGQFVHRVDEIGGLADSPDPLTFHPRYVWTVSVSVRGTV